MPLSQAFLESVGETEDLAEARREGKGELAMYGEYGDGQGWAMVDSEPPSEVRAMRTRAQSAVKEAACAGAGSALSRDA